MHQVTLFQLNSDQDISARHPREQEVTNRHVWCKPESDQKSQHDRVADKLIKHRGAEAQFGLGLSSQLQEHLSQAEEVEVIDQECTEQHDEPAEPRESV